MPEPIRFALVGAGAIAKTWAEALVRAAGAELVVVADTDVEAAHRLAEPYGCRSLPHHREVVASGLADAVIVASPPASHPRIVIDCVEHGLHVLCEKPLSIDLSSALSMLTAARQAGVVLTMASKYRFVPDVERAKELLEDGTVGELQLLENSFTGLVPMASRWNSCPAQSGGGVLIDNGTHSLDLARYFMGPPSHVQVIEGPRPQGLDVEETVHIALLTECGAMGVIDLSWSLRKLSEDYLTLYGALGVVCVGWTQSRYRRHDEQRWHTFGTGYDKVEAFVRQLENFVAGLRGEAALRITAEDAVGSVSAVASAYRAMRRGVWEPIVRQPAAAAMAGA